MRVGYQYKVYPNCKAATEKSKVKQKSYTYWSFCLSGLCLPMLIGVFITTNMLMRENNVTTFVAVALIVILYDVVLSAVGAKGAKINSDVDAFYLRKIHASQDEIDEVLNEGTREFKETFLFLLKLTLVLTVLIYTIAFGVFYSRYIFIITALIILLMVIVYNKKRLKGVFSAGKHVSKSKQTDKMANKQLREKEYVNISQADEIRKFKTLYEEGIITREEYEAKKKKLLDD